MNKANAQANVESSISPKTVAMAGYALLCYALSVVSLLYFALFVNGLLIASTVNAPISDGSLVQALCTNLFALSLFAVQHSVMARKSFKQTLYRFISPHLERSTYCLATALALSCMCWIWVPFGPVLWSIDTRWLALVVQLTAVSGWGLLLVATFMLDHFELFGLKQGFSPLVGRKFVSLGFKEPGLYRIVRHPIQTGVLIGVWCVPLSTASHLMMAMGLTMYILIGLYFEERDLLSEYGDRYLDYAKRVRRLIPFVY